MFEITVTTSDKLKMLAPRQVISAEVRAINKTARGLRTQISKSVRNQLNIKASAVKESLSIAKATRRPRPSATLSVAAKPVSLKEYGARQNRKGVSVRVKRANGRKLIKHAFVVQVLGSHAFQRVGDARLPIKKLFGPSVKQEAEQLSPEFRIFISKTLEKRIREEIDWEIEKLKRRGKL